MADGSGLQIDRLALFGLILIPPLSLPLPAASGKQIRSFSSVGQISFFLTFRIYVRSKNLTQRHFLNHASVLATAIVLLKCK